MTFENFIKMIKDFDSITKNTLAQCNRIKDLCEELGYEIGGALHNACKNRIEIKRREGSLTWKSELGYNVAGSCIETIVNELFAGIGEEISDFKIKNAKKRILKNIPQIEQRYNEHYPTLCEILNLQIANHIRILKDDKYILFSDNKYLRQRIATVQNHINAIYKCEYRRLRGQQLARFFSNYIRKIDDLEVFSNWINSEFSLDEYIVYNKIVSKVSNEILSFKAEDHKIKKALKKISCSKPRLSIKKEDFLLSTTETEKNPFLSEQSEENDSQGVVDDKQNECVYIMNKNGKLESYSIL